MESIFGCESLHSLKPIIQPDVTKEKGACYSPLSVLSANPRDVNPERSLCDGLVLSALLHSAKTGLC